MGSSHSAVLDRSTNGPPAASSARSPRRLAARRLDLVPTATL